MEKRSKRQKIRKGKKDQRSKIRKIGRKIRKGKKDQRSKISKIGKKSRKGDPIKKKIREVRSKEKGKEKVRNQQQPTCSGAHAH
jgi:hypothetical protein